MTAPFAASITLTERNSPVATLVRGVSALSGSPIEELCLGYVEVDDELRALLASLAPTLNRLVITPTRLYHPKSSAIYLG